MLGLAVEGVVPSRPSGPAVACKVQFGPSERPEASVQVATTDGSGSAWTAIGKFSLAVGREESGKAKSEAFGDALAEELLNRLVKVSLKKASTNTGGLIPAAPTKGKDQYTIRVENYSPLLLNGVAVAGVGRSRASRRRCCWGSRCRRVGRSRCRRRVSRWSGSG